MPDDGRAIFTVSTGINDTPGEYHAIATFDYIEDGVNVIKSVPCDYDCIDPFERTGATTADPAIDLCWMKFEDCFDSELGGPWLRDMTLARFDKSKIAGFLPDVMFEINQMQPITDYTPESFDYTGDGKALAAQGLLVYSINHLRRAYAEQPDITNSQVGFFDRKRYYDVWTAIYQNEYDRWLEWVGHWKIRAYNAASMRTLVSTKAGRLLPAPLRSRYVGRGYY